MSSVTAVPLLPIQKGSVTRLWLAMLLLLLVAAALAWVGLRQFGETQSGLKYQIVKAGEAEHPARDDFAYVAYRGTLPDGTVFDESPGAPMDLSNMIQGFSEAVTLIGEGGKVIAWLPPELAYGDDVRPGSPIPPGSALRFEITLLEYRTRAEMMEMQRQQQMQQMLQQQMGGGVPMPEGDIGAP